MQKLRKQVRDLQTLLDRDGPTMGEAERRNKERDLANQMRDLQRMQREIREDSTCAATRSSRACRSARTR